MWDEKWYKTCREVNIPTTHLAPSVLPRSPSLAGMGTVTAFI